MYYSNKYRILPGDDVTEAIFLTGLSKHHAIYLGADPHGVEWMAENHKFVGVRLVTAQQYFNSAKNYTVIPFKGSQQERRVAIERALAKVGAPYNLVTYNCEHYASFVQTGNAKSKQVANVFGAVAAVFVVALFAKAFTKD